MSKFMRRHRSPAQPIDYMRQVKQCIGLLDGIFIQLESTNAKLFYIKQNTQKEKVEDYGSLGRGSLG